MNAESSKISTRVFFSAVPIVGRSNTGKARRPADHQLLDNRGVLFLHGFGQAKDGREALTMAAFLQPDVMTMDINMPRMGGLEATLHIRRRIRGLLSLSVPSRAKAPPARCVALELGAIDFVTKPSSGIDLDMKTSGGTPSQAQDAGKSPRWCARRAADAAGAPEASPQCSPRRNPGEWRQDFQ